MRGSKKCDWDVAIRLGVCRRESCLLGTLSSQTPVAVQRPAKAKKRFLFAMTAKQEWRARGNAVRWFQRLYIGNSPIYERISWDVRRRRAGVERERPPVCELGQWGVCSECLVIVASRRACEHGGGVIGESRADWAVVNAESDWATERSYVQLRARWQPHTWQCTLWSSCRHHRHSLKRGEETYMPV
jgi:hypothetical protein